MVHQDCNCHTPHPPNEVVSCQSVLTGSFTTVNGIVFSATMSATGSGKDCESAIKNSEMNIQKTLDNFLKYYKPHIVKHTHTVKTSCEGCHDPVPPVPEPVIATHVVELDYVSDTEAVGDSGFVNTYIRLGQGVGVPNTFLEATFLNLDVDAIIYKSHRVPLATSDFTFNFYPVPVTETVYTEKLVEQRECYVEPDTFPPGADSALRSGAALLEGFDQPLWTGRVNLDNLIEFKETSPLVSVSNKLTFSLDNPFFLPGGGKSKRSKPKSHNTITGKARLEFRVVNLAESEIPAELK